MNIRQFRFLTDENIDEELVAFLRAEGLDVFDIKEERLFRLSDRAILELALAERRVVVSEDSDFGTLIFRDNVPFYGVVYLRPGHESPKVHVETFAAILVTELDFSIPFILVAENTGEFVRIRLRNI
jgi:predicted nuclease of predicted toxin-antitoxin system